MLRSVVLSLALLVITVQPLLAACVEQAIPELRRGAALTILRTDGTVTTASFIRAESDPPRLVLEERGLRSQRAPRQFDLPTSDIARLEAPPLPKFHGERIGIGMLAGFGVGGLVGVMIPIRRNEPPVPTSFGFVNQPPPANRLEAILLGGVSGAIVGALAGLFVSTGGGKPRIWSCEEANPAAPDSTR